VNRNISYTWWESNCGSYSP